MTSDEAMASSEANILNPAVVFPYPPQKMLVLGTAPPALTSHPHYSAEKRIWKFEEAMTQNSNHVQSDCVIVGPTDWRVSATPLILSKMSGILDELGRISFIFDPSHPPPCTIDEMNRLFDENDLMMYDDGRISSSQWGIVAVKRTYNPVAHAREAAASGRPDRAIQIIETIPSVFIPNEDVLARLALEKQRFYLSWQTCNDNAPPHALFSKARREFAQVTALDPYMVETYRLHERCWSNLGRPDMAARVHRSIQHLMPDVLMATPHKSSSPPDRHMGDDSERPLWAPETQPVRVLVITHDHSDYGMDTLYHGLVTLLGKKNVVEYPWKPTLHGKNYAAAFNYPCVFNYPGDPQSVDDLEQSLTRGEFDLIVYADVVQMTRGEEIKRLVNANVNIPVVLYDTWDDCFTPMQQVLKYIGRTKFDVIFKREMLAGIAYDPHTYALPFGYSQSFLKTHPKTDGIETIFWAGKKEYGLRPLYIPALEKRLGYSLDRRFDQDTYQSKLANSRMGLSFFGCGFDSVRYWELPANGVMLMAERPPIRIPHNFVDGQSAVFFDDLPEMEEKLDFYIRRPHEMERIAAAGHSHYLKHHTTTMRARQFLGVIDRKLNGRLSTHSSSAISTTSLPTSERMVPPLFLGLAKGENYGWGVCSKYLIRELSAFRQIHVLDPSESTSACDQLKGSLFQALTDVDFTPLFENTRGTQNIGYTFFENELSPTSVENAKKYDMVLAGSSWCRDRMLEKGITNCDVLIQGIDPKRFYPITRKKRQDRFVIFSGGKFEPRKGQDLLLKAVKVLQEKYADVYLVNCWYNMWPASIRQMTISPYINFAYDPNDNWTDTMQRTYENNGLDPQRVKTLEIVRHEDLRTLYEETDIGVFPNRCEGGTNLVLMEYMACAKPVIASYTSGHKDILTRKNALLLTRLKDINIRDDSGALIGRWQDPSLEELIANLEYAYHHREALDTIARQAGEDLKNFTWKQSAHRLVNILRHCPGRYSDHAN